MVPSPAHQLLLGPGHEVTQLPAHQELRGRLAGVPVLRVPVLEDGSGELCRVELAGNGDIVSDHSLH